MNIEQKPSINSKPIKKIILNIGGVIYLNSNNNVLTCRRVDFWIHLLPWFNQE
jgi:hypothetical protein